MTRKRRIGILITFASLCFIAASCFSFCSAFRSRGVDPEANERPLPYYFTTQPAMPVGSVAATLLCWDDASCVEAGIAWSHEQTDAGSASFCLLGSGYNIPMTTTHVLLEVGGQYQDGPRSSTHIYYVDGGAEEFRGVGGLPCNDACSSMMTSPRTKEEVAFRGPYVDRLLRIVSDCIREQCGVVPVKGARP